jgi:hypothetical protein
MVFRSNLEKCNQKYCQKYICRDHGNLSSLFCGILYEKGERYCITFLVFYFWQENVYPTQCVFRVLNGTALSYTCYSDVDIVPYLPERTEL